MPSNINPVQPPDLSQSSKPVEQEKKKIRGLDIPKNEPPDVSSWVRKANAVLSRPWQENELRCGRALTLGNVAPDVAIELARVFNAFEVKIGVEKAGIIITFKPVKQIAQNK